jgi:hypothetical protein
MNLRIFLALDSFPVESREQWRSIFLVIHAAITAFFTSSLSTRLVFASVSLEGRQFWILQASPLSMRALLESKCVAWFLPISLLSAVLFSIGVFLIFERIETVVLFTALSFFISYSLVSVGIGLGAWFADFTWEHPSQLAMSFGGFIYMVASAILVLGNLMPLTMIVRLTATTPAASSPLATLWMLLVASLVVLANTLIARAAMRLGERSLLRRDTN